MSDIYVCDIYAQITISNLKTPTAHKYAPKYLQEMILFMIFFSINVLLELLSDLRLPICIKQLELFITYATYIASCAASQCHDQWQSICA